VEGIIGLVLFLVFTAFLGSLVVRWYRWVNYGPRMRPGELEAFLEKVDDWHSAPVAKNRNVVRR
jgi:hypothetical protein